MTNIMKCKSIQKNGTFLNGHRIVGQLINSVSVA